MKIVSLKGNTSWPPLASVVSLCNMRPLIVSCVRKRQVWKGPPAAYRSRDGHWLSSSVSGNTQVWTLRQTELLAALSEGLPEGTIKRGAAVVGAHADAQGVSVTLSDGRHVQGGRTGSLARQLRPHGSRAWSKACIW
eukprot:6173766-Pleurochrysis_carterae.AAC.3